MVISCNLNEAILSYGGMGVRRGDFILYYQQLKLKNYTILKYTTCNFIWLKCKIYDFYAVSRWFSSLYTVSIVLRNVRSSFSSTHSPSPPPLDLNSLEF